MNQSYARRLAGLILGAATLVAAAPASAATPHITGDDGAVVPLTSGASLRHMSPDVTFAFAPEETHYAARVVGPAGPASIGTDCLRTDSPFAERVRYQGNGTYTVFYKSGGSADGCAAATEASATFTINAATSLAGAPATFVRRAPGSAFSLPLELAVNTNPGAETYEIKYAAGATLAPDGGIAGTSESAFVDMATGKTRITFFRPGRYTIVMRAKTFRSDVATGWSAPTTITVKDPFDLSFATLTDTIGPKYALAATVRETSARGKVTVSLGKGKNPKRFRKLGTAKIRKGGKFKMRFRKRGYGNYVMKFAYKGGPTVTAGADKRPIRFFRTFRRG